VSETRPILRDCPFCHTDGGNDEKIHFSGNLIIHDGGEYIASYSIFCIVCGVELHDEDKDELVRLWNGVVATDEADDAACSSIPTEILSKAKETEA
jgi:hypothetical protein